MLMNYFIRNTCTYLMYVCSGINSVRKFLDSLKRYHHSSEESNIEPALMMVVSFHESEDE
jgi:hypothetical protein